MKGLIDAGYVCCPTTLYKVSKGKKMSYAYDDVPLERLLTDYGSELQFNDTRGSWKQRSAIVEAIHPSKRTY